MSDRNSTVSRPIQPFLSVGAARKPSIDLDMLHRRWAMFADDLAIDGVELTPEEFAPVLATFNALYGRGHHFDGVFVALMRILESQVINGPDDTDSTRCDEVNRPEFESVPAMVNAARERMHLGQPLG